ncbi:MAG: efflux RND transporter periplasmic adaptor subunit [Planctomycetia bacterium]|nr:efflux RND transporter periplasmic adaptor subunit [Planctomycetia bacterium]
MFRTLFRTVAIVSALSSCASIARGQSHDSFTEPFRKIDLAPAETGVVAEIVVKEGDVVKAGAIMASLDRDVLTIARDIAHVATTADGRQKASLAEFRLKEARLKKMRELQAKGHATPDEVQKAEAEFESAEGQRRIVEEQHQLDLLELKKTEAMIERRLIRSPIDGVVTKIHREQGEFVTPVAPTVVTVVQIHPLRAVFNLPRAAGASLQVGKPVRLKMADTELEIAGKVEFVAPVFDAESETIRVKVLIEKSRDQVSAGCRCSILLDEASADASVVNR